MGRLVHLTCYYSVVEAKVCVSMLEAHGIYACAPMEFVSITSNYMTAHGGIQIAVVDTDYEIARMLLDAARELPVDQRPKRRRVSEGICGALILIAFGVAPAPTPAFGHSQLRFQAVIATFVLITILVYLLNLVRTM